MKLAEALIERADLQRRLARLAQRLVQNAQYQEGEMPSENPQELLAEYRSAAAALTALIVRINRTNNTVVLPDGMTMTEALAERDRLKDEHAVLVKLADAATPEQARYSRSEIKTLAAVDVKDIRRQADDTARRCRALDVRVQQANWQEDLL